MNGAGKMLQGRKLSRLKDTESRIIIEINIYRDFREHNTVSKLTFSVHSNACNN
jgi:hypothetical protein